jgi:hypothetical protein
MLRYFTVAAHEVLTCAASSDVMLFFVTSLVRAGNGSVMMFVPPLAQKDTVEIFFLDS